jgi:hypothetical protein
VVFLFFFTLYFFSLQFNWHSFEIEPLPILSSKVETCAHKKEETTKAAQDGSDSFIYSSIGQSHDSWRLFSTRFIAPLTKEAQEFLVLKQFPTVCRDQGFAISRGNGINGIGSQLHVATLHLSIALEQNRIFLWGDEAGRSFTDDSSCPYALNFECFFRALSSCTLEDARMKGADTIELEYATAGAHFGFKEGFVPTAIKKIWLNQAPVPNAMELKYWWRAQAVAFLARFNNATIEAIRALRLNSSAVLISSGIPPLPHPASSMVGPGWPPPREADLAAGKAMAASFPFKRGTTSIHVRHGDKATEMTLVPDEKYFSAAESLVMHHPMGLSRAAFISTEDPGTLVAASNEHRGWALMWYDVPRINSNGVDQLQKLQMPRAKLTRIWFLQLLMALECDAWVGTRGSNWNR